MLTMENERNYDVNGNEIIRYDWDDLAMQVLDMLMERPQGVSLLQIAEQLAVPHHVGRRAIVVLREHLAEDGDTNIIAVPFGRDRRYQLVQEAGVETDAWLRFHRIYLESRLTTLVQVYGCLARGSSEEKQREIARRVHKGLLRIQEDISELEV